MPSIIHSSFIKYEPYYLQETQYPLLLFFQPHYFNHKCFVWEQYFRPYNDYLQASMALVSLTLNAWGDIYWPERVHRYMYIVTCYMLALSSCVGGCGFIIYRTNLSRPLNFNVLSFSIHYNGKNRKNILALY